MTVIGALDDLAEGTPLRVEIDGRVVCVVRIGDSSARESEPAGEAVTTAVERRSCP